MPLLLANLCLAATASDAGSFLCVSVVLFFFVVGAVLHWRSEQRKASVGPIALSFVPGSPRMGETCQARLSVRPSQAILVDGLAIRVQASERVSWRDGSGEKVQTRSQGHLVFDLVLETRRPGAITPPEVLHETFEFTIPPLGPPSFKSAMNEIEWKVHITLLVGGRAFGGSYPFKVPPVTLVSPATS